MRRMFEDLEQPHRAPVKPETVDPGTGVPLFTKEDIGRGKAINVLDTLLRGFFIQQGITKEIFNYRFHDYALNKLGLHSTELNWTKGNLLKAIYKGNITFFVFRRALMSMGYELRNVTAEITNDQNQRITISMQELGELLAGHKAKPGDAASDLLRI